MASPVPAVPGSEPVPPSADPRAIRACLPPTLVAEFDREWDIVLDEAKRAKDLTPVHDLLAKWRHIAYTELTNPGSYYGLLAKAEQIMRSGVNPNAASIEDMKAMLQERLGR